MAYTEAEQRFIAREIARAGGNLSATIKNLRERCSDFPTISENTLRRILRKPGFVEIVAAQGEMLRKAGEEGALQAERDRARREVEGLIVNRLARDELILDEIRKKVEDACKTLNPETLGEAVNAFKAFAAIVDRRNANSATAVAQTWEAQALVESVSEVLHAKVPTRVSEITAAIRDRYAEKINARAAVQPEPANVDA